jgi:hypothetical protein
METSSPTTAAVTFGEMRVGITFNPSGNEKVNSIKRSAAALIDELQTYRRAHDPNEKEQYPNQFIEVERLISLAQTNIEEAAMCAVKAVTK